MCGPALIVSDLPEWNEGYVTTGVALSCNPDEPQQIAEAIRWFATHRTETAAMDEAGRQKILADWNYKTQFACQPNGVATIVGALLWFVAKSEVCRNMRLADRARISAEWNYGSQFGPVADQVLGKR